MIDRLAASETVERTAPARQEAELAQHAARRRVVGEMPRHHRPHPGPRLQPVHQGLRGFGGIAMAPGLRRDPVAELEQVARRLAPHADTADQLPLALNHADMVGAGEMTLLRPLQEGAGFVLRLTRRNPPDIAIDARIGDQRGDRAGIGGQGRAQDQARGGDFKAQHD